VQGRLSDLRSAIDDEVDWGSDLNSADVLSAASTLMQERDVRMPLSLMPLSSAQERWRTRGQHLRQTRLASV
jgi:hypothetical protein